MIDPAMAGPSSSDPLVSPFWQAARQGQLSLPWCDHCDRAVWYPQPSCPQCSGELAWRTLSGRARLLTWTVVRKPLSPLFAVPYIPALVIPDEAPYVHLVTQLTNCDPAELSCDQPMQVVFAPLQPISGEPYTAPLFTPRRAV